MTAVLTLTDDRVLEARDVHDVLARSILADGLDLVLDLDRSTGSYLVDARTGERYLDMFTFFASSALGMNHPALVDDEASRVELAQAAVNKPSNSDVYSVPMARFVDTFVRVLGDPELPPRFLRRRRRAGGRDRLEGGVRLEEPPQRGARHRSRVGHQGAAPARGVPRPQRVHAVADQHRPHQGGPLPEVRLAPH